MDLIALAQGALITEPVKSIVDHVRSGWIKNGRDILLNELRRGNVDLNRVREKDEFADRMVMYWDATLEGRAKRNLHLLAQFTVKLPLGQPIYNSLGQGPFRRWKDILKTLSYEEIMVLASFVRNTCEDQRESILKFHGGPREEISKSVYDELSGIFDTSELVTILHGLTNTGLVMQETFSTDSQIETFPTTYLFDIAKLTDFRRAIDECEVG